MVNDESGVAAGAVDAGFATGTFTSTSLKKVLRRNEPILLRPCVFSSFLTTVDDMWLWNCERSTIEVVELFHRTMAWVFQYSQAAR